MSIGTQRLIPRVSEEVLVAASQTDSHAAVAATVFLLWDAIIHLDDELEFIWLGPNSWTKFMYIFIRWMPILGEAALFTIITGDSTHVHFTTKGCRNWIIFEAVVVECMIFAVELVLIIRVYALYNQNRFILWALSACFAGEILVMVTVIVVSSPKMEFNAQCLITSAPRISMAFWLTSLAFESVLFILTLAQLFMAVHREKERGNMINVFVRDGIWAFGMIFVVMLLNTLMYQLLHTPLAGIFYFWAVSVTSFAGSHLLLNLRRLGRELQGTPVGIFTTNCDVNLESTAFSMGFSASPDAHLCSYGSLTNGDIRLEER